ncbi:hypothetical protein, partial [Nocardioides sp.]|uniref:hypothetical protein n=1 Tax=Nocardioides sp. TaxID=35761 RepID=UPI0039E66BD3
MSEVVRHDSAPARSTDPGQQSRRRRPGRIGGLVRLARRLTGRARKPAAQALSAAVPVARAAAR